VNNGSVTQLNLTGSHISMHS